MFHSDTFARQTQPGAQVLEVHDVGAKVRYAEFSYTTTGHEQEKEIDLLRLPAGSTKVLGASSLLVFEGKLPDKAKISFGHRAYRHRTYGEVAADAGALDADVLAKNVMRLGSRSPIGTLLLESREAVDLFLSVPALPAGLKITGYIFYLRD